MKTKELKPVRRGFYICTDDKDYDVINELRTKYAINISQLFKIFMYEYLEKIRKLGE